MRAPIRALFATAALFATTAAADQYDLRLYKLGNPAVDGANGDPRAQENFRAFARTFGAALSSVTLGPPETLGHAGFAVNAELAVVQLDAERVRIPTVRQGEGRAGIDGALLLPSVHVRKGLPWSFELGTRVMWIEKSRMFAGTGEVKWALNEGFAYLPDLGVRGHVTRLFNSPDLHLTTGGLDLALGKQFAVGGMVTLTPYVGWNLVWVAAASNTVDFEPSRSREAHQRSPASSFENTNVYRQVELGSNAHNRFYGGIRFIGGVLQLGAEYSVSQLPRLPVEGTGEFIELPSVSAFNFTVGLDF